MPYLPIDKTYPIQRMNFGDVRSRGGRRHILGVSYGYTQQRVRPDATSSTGIMAATALSSSAANTISTGITNPKVPRNVTVTLGGTATDIAAGTITVYGTNVEGKVISEDFTATVDTAGTLSGVKAFKTVTSVTAPQQDGAGATLALGFGNKFGLRHRLPTGTTTANIRIVQSTGTVDTLQSTPSAVAVSPTLVESNTVTSAAVPDGTFSMTIHYYYVKWVLDPINDLAHDDDVTNYGAK